MCKETDYIIWRDEDKDHCQIRLIHENQKSEGPFYDDILYSNLNVELATKLRNYLNGWLERQGEA